MANTPISTADPAAQSPRVMVILFTDLVGSTGLKEEIGVEKYCEMKGRHDGFIRQALAAAPSGRVLSDTGDGFFVSFSSIQEGVRAALIFQWLMLHEPWAHPFTARVGLHLGEVEQGISQVTQLASFVSSAIDLGSRTMSLAVGGQILLTRLMYDAARPTLREHPPVGEASATPTLRWMSHGQYNFKGAVEPMEVFEVGAEGVAPLHAPPDSEKAKRHSVAAQKRRNRMSAWLLAAGVLVALLVAGGWYWKQRNDQMVEIKREQIEREVARLLGDPPVAIREHPPSFRLVDLVQIGDNAAFDVLDDHRVIDLRGWKEVPPEKVSELFSPVTMVCRRQIKKKAAADHFEVELRTAGLDVFLSTDGKYPFTVEAQRGASFVGTEPMKVKKFIADVSSVPIGEEFNLRDTATFWNSIQTEEEQWFGVAGYEKSTVVSMLILFPAGKHFKSYELTVAETSKHKPLAFTGPRMVLADASQSWIYWQVPDPSAGHIYRLKWEW